MTSEILTDRLRLRTWLPTDRVPFATLNADPRGMEHFVSTVSRERSDALASQFEATFDRYGFGFWAVEVPGMACRMGTRFVVTCCIGSAIRSCPRSVCSRRRPGRQWARRG